MTTYRERRLHSLDDDVHMQRKYHTVTFRNTQIEKKTSKLLSARVRVRIPPVLYRI